MPEKVALTAEQITVKLEGPGFPGSGVLIKNDNQRYTVLTAWHVVSGLRQKEELNITTSDGRTYNYEPGSIVRLGRVDLAVLRFTAGQAYPVAVTGDSAAVVAGQPLFVGGFPLPTSAVPVSVFRFYRGDVIANAKVEIPNGYQLLYSNPTLPGMSGGPVLNFNGQLVGIHGQGETDVTLTEQEGLAVKTGTNQAVPIIHYLNYIKPSINSNIRNASILSDDDHIAMAQSEVLTLLGRIQGLIDKNSVGQWNNDAFVRQLRQHALKSVEKLKSSQRVLSKPSARLQFLLGFLLSENFAIYDYSAADAEFSSGIRLLNGSLKSASNGLLLTALYAGRADARLRNGKPQLAIEDANHLLALQPDHAAVRFTRAKAYLALGKGDQALKDLDRVINQKASDRRALLERGRLHENHKRYDLALRDFDAAIQLNSADSLAYRLRSRVYVGLGQAREALSDLARAIRLDPRGVEAYEQRFEIYRTMNDFAGMLADSNSLVGLQPSNPSYYRLRSLALINLKRYEQSLADANALLRLDPKSGVGYFMRGLSQLGLNHKQDYCLDLASAVANGFEQARSLYRESCP